MILLILLILGLQRAELLLHVAQLRSVALCRRQLRVEVGNVGVPLRDLPLQRGDLLVAGFDLRGELLGGHIATLGQVRKANVLCLVGLILVHLVDSRLYLCVQLRGQKLTQFHGSSISRRVCVSRRRQF